MEGYIFEVLDFVGVKDVVLVGKIDERTLCHDADEKIVTWVDCFVACIYSAPIGISFYMAVGG